MKQISVKFQQQEQTYRSLHAAARSLLSSKGRVFLLFLLFYKVLTNFLFVPALQLIWALTLRFAPIRYLNNKTASRIFASPAITSGASSCWRCWQPFGACTRLPRCCSY